MEGLGITAKGVKWPAASLMALTALAVFAPRATAQTAAPSAASASALVNKYCIFCHSEKLKTAGVVLEGLDFTQPGANAALLEKVLHKVRTGEMPPPPMPHPDQATRESFTGWLADALDRDAAAHPNPGRPAIHRLNRAEYSNAVRDILAVDVHAGDLLPVDDSGYGFDNIADVLSVSPSLLERYISTARMVSRLAVGDPGIKPAEEDFVPAAVRRAGGSRQQTNERASDDLPFDSAGGMSFTYYFPLDGEYVIRVKAGGGGDGQKLEVRQTVQAGLRTVGVAFLRESAKPEVELLGGRGPAAAGGGGRGGASSPAEMDLRLDGVRIKRFEVPHGPNTPLPAFNGVSVAGPYNATGSGVTASRSRIFVCHPQSGAAAGKSEDACAHTILANLARRAFRRNVTEADIRPLMSFYQSGKQQGDFDHGIEMALRAMLVSPDFLFRVEHDPKGAAPGTAYRLNDFELASRLSFFLWSSVPDDRLLDLAERGKLKEPAVLCSEVRRMLADPKSQALVDNFAGQWLYLRNLAVAKPDPEIFPEFDESLREGFLEETDLFFQSILREDRPVTDLLDANYTYLNQRLAEHYGIPGVYGSQFRRVTLDTPERGGLLGQGSILTVTSYPNRTSVVQRGKWILETLLGVPPPPPPPDIPELKPQSKDGRTLTMREQMTEHRANAVCASCHMRMDPLGFAMENYDGVGKWRVKDAGGPIDPSGKLPDGTQFEGPAGLRKALLAGHRDEFIGTLTEKMLTYALGRGVEYYDKPAVRSIAREAARDNYRISALVTAIVNSTPFQMRETRKP
jgi:mono/diheme cytochrome c family protein